MKEKTIAEHNLTTPSTAAESLCSLHEMDPDTYKDLMKYARPKQTEKIVVEPPRQVHYVDVGGLDANNAIKIVNCYSYNYQNTVPIAMASNVGLGQVSNAVVHFRVSGNTAHYARGLDTIHKK